MGLAPAGGCERVIKGGVIPLEIETQGSGLSRENLLVTVRPQPLAAVGLQGQRSEGPQWRPLAVIHKLSPYHSPHSPSFCLPLGSPLSWNPQGLSQQNLAQWRRPGLEASSDP